MSFVCPTCHEAGLPVAVECPSCCQVCRDMDKAMVAVSFDESRLRELNKKWLKHMSLYHRGVSTFHSGNGAPKGAFAFTLTKAPTDDLSEEDMVTAVRKLMAQRSCPVKKYAWYLEYGDNVTKEHPHIHGMYETESGGRIERKHFKRVWPIWDESQRFGRGHRGGYHDIARNEKGYSEYIKEDYGLNGVGDSHGVEKCDIA